MPAAAHAQGATLDGAPLNVYASGFGAIQVRVDGLPAGLFYDPAEDPAHAGLEIKEGDAYYPLEDGFNVAPGRTNVEPAVVVANADGSRTLHTAYTVGPHLRVSEDHTYADGTTSIAAHYAITNVSAAPVSLRAGALADLYVGNNDSGNGVISNVAPRFVGGRDEAAGLVYGLQEVTPWGALQEGDYERVFDNFAGAGLDNTVDALAPDNGVGVSWELDNVAPGETRTLDVRWLLAAAAPPGTTSPGGPDADGVIHAVQGGTLPPPVPGKAVNVRLLKGKVCFTPPKTKKCIPLKDPVQIPLGSLIDTTKGRIALVSAADKDGTVQSAWFYSGIFKIGQTKGSSPITELTLAGPKLSCTKPKKAKRAVASAKKKKPKTRRLWGNGKGRFRTNGQFSSATVRGTKWVVIDRCDGTLTQVKQGSVLVRDKVRRKNVIVRAGKQYLARKKK
ncbi:MAG TPA: hypothetical protein VNS09_24325 [Solirubrobacter sp.]|nr:hypothetical protein [Solirubrobacter sp.]